MKFTYRNEISENDIYISAIVDGLIKKMIFTKSDIKNIGKNFSIIRIYFGKFYANLISNKKDDCNIILDKIKKSAEIKTLFKKKLNIKNYSLSQFNISEIYAFLVNIDKVYKLEFIENSKPINLNANNFNIIDQNQNNPMFLNNQMSQMNPMKNQMEMLNQMIINNQMLLNNINFNNQILKKFQNNNINNMINYKEEIEKRANKYFKAFFFEGYEKQYFPKKSFSSNLSIKYINSILHCIIHIPELNLFFFSLYNQFKLSNINLMNTTTSKGKISEEYFNLLKQVFSLDQNTISSKNFFNQIIKLYNIQQNDNMGNAINLLLFILDSLHKELNYYANRKIGNLGQIDKTIESEAFNYFFEINTKLNFSIISYLFYSIIKQTTRCNGCGTKYYDYQYYPYLTFSLEKYHKRNFNIYMGFKDFISKIVLKGDNKFFCQNCGCLRDGELYYKFHYFPPYLLIYLDYGVKEEYKPNKVDFGAVIAFTVEFIDLNSPENFCNYKLIISNVKKGSGKNAEFMTFCRDEEKSEYLKFNDSGVSSCDLEELEKYNPYLLMFKKIEDKIKINK